MKTPSSLERLMFGFMESQILFVLHDIGVFEYLNKRGASPAGPIGRDLKISPSSLERLLIGAVCSDLLDKTGEIYDLPLTLKPFLIKSSPHYIGDRFSHYWKTSYGLCTHLKSAVLENKPQWDKLDPSVSNPNDLNFVYNQAIYQDSATTAEFLETMWASGYEDSVDLCSKYSLDDHHVLVDLGGATGSFAIAAAKKNPKLQAVILDYPVVEPYAIEKIQHHSLQSCVQFKAGDLFDSILPQGDVYVIGYVLSDWPEPVCLSLLKTVYKHLPSGGTLLILEKFFDENKKGPYLTAMLNTIMLLEMHGSHKTSTEYQKMLQPIGFQDFQVIRSSGEKHMLVAKKGSQVI